LVAVLASVLLALPAQAAPGDLDPTFSGNGKVTTNFTPGLDDGSDVAIQDNGKIVVVGLAGAGGTFGIARYLTNGTLDPTFGGDGKVRTDFTAHTDDARGVAIQEDGKIVVVGNAGVGTSDTSVALARYRTNGTLDPTFGGDGKVRTNFTPNLETGHDVVIQDNGRIVAAGSAGGTFFGHSGGFAWSRYFPNGHLDPSFGDDGMVRTNMSDDSDVGLGVALQSDGKIVTAGVAGGLDPWFALTRHHPNGVLDTTFSGDGRVLTRFGGAPAEAHDLAIQENGRIVAAGLAFAPDWAFALARYRVNGNLDDTFGGDGRVRTEFSQNIDQANDVAIQTDGRIVAAGMAEGDPFDPEFALTRYEIDGTLDGTFGTNGRVTTNFSPRADEASGVAIQEDGRIVAAGAEDLTEHPQSQPRFAVARYLAA
jgi:uncharacterized delta-60 repeat protein